MLTVCQGFCSSPSVKMKNNRKVRGLEFASAAADLPELRPAAAGRSWRAAGRCRCWWASGRRGRPCGAACGGRSCTRCASSPGWWAGGRCRQTHCSRWGTTGTPSTEPPAPASCCHAAEGGAAELRGNSCQRQTDGSSGWSVPTTSVRGRRTQTAQVTESNAELNAQQMIFKWIKRVFFSCGLLVK